MRVKSRELRVEGCRIAIALRARCDAQPSNLNPQPRPGLTLIELLVVIIILTTVVAAAIPILSPSDNDRRLREATRALNTVITSAQAKAIQLRRPYGIALKRLSWDTDEANDLTKPHDDRGVCVEVFFAEQLPPYTGFDPTSMARLSLYTPANSNWYGGLRNLVRIQFVKRGNATTQAIEGLPTGWDPDLFPGETFRPGDVIEISGTRYELLSDVKDRDVPPSFDSTGAFFESNTGKDSPTSQDSTQIVARPLNDTGQMISVKYDDFGYEIGTPLAKNPPFFTSPAPYKILRQPTLTSKDPFQMPDGTAIDLRASGIGADNYFFDPSKQLDNNAYVYIMFAPEGRISRVQFDRTPGDPVRFDAPVVDNVFLLVGNRENIPAPDAGADPTLSSDSSTGWPSAKTDEERQELKEPVNWLSGESRWVVLGPQSGRVVTVEIGAVDPAVVLANNLGATAEVKRTAQITAAREFTRGMANVGGR